jgi:hypothetical protein
MWDDVADLAVKAAVDTMGRACTYRGRGGSPVVTFKGVYRAPSQQTRAELDMHVPITSTRPTLKIRTRDFPAGHPKPGGELDVAGPGGVGLLTFYVDDVHPEHLGSAVLDLINR